MAYEDIIRAHGYWKAAADLSGDQYKFVKLNSSQQVARCDTLGEVAVGVLQNKPKAGEACTISPPAGNITKVVAGAAIAVMAQVTPMADGRAQTAATGHNAAGIALEPAAAAGDIISVLQTANGKI